MWPLMSKDAFARCRASKTVPNGLTNKVFTRIYGDQDWNQVAMIFGVIPGTVIISKWVSARVRQPVI